MTSHLTETFEETSYGLGYVRPYWWSWPEDLPKNSNSGALANFYSGWSGQGRLIGFTVTNTNTNAQFVLAFGKTANPGNGAVPVFGFNVAGSSFIAVFFGESGRWFHQGFSLANSSTLGTLTIGAADCIFDIQYVPQVI